MQDRIPFLQVILAQHSSVCGCQQTTCAAQRCSKLRHPLLWDVDVSATTSGFRLVLQYCDQLPPNSKSRFQRSSLFRLQIRRQITTVVLLTMCSPSRVLKPSQQPSNHFTANFCSGPAVFFTPSLPTWNVVNVHAACLRSHAKDLPESVLEWFELLAQCCRCRCCLRLDSLRKRFWLGCVCQICV